jgi:hypothetical protein
MDIGNSRADFQNLKLNRAVTPVRVVQTPTMSSLNPAAGVYDTPVGGVAKPHVCNLAHVSPVVYSQCTVSP